VCFFLWISLLTRSKPTRQQQQQQQQQLPVNHIILTHRQTTTTTTTNEDDDNNNNNNNNNNSMSFGMGLLAVTAAPCWMALGFFLWDHHWTASAFALNLFKCNLASLGFLTVVLVELAMTTTTTPQHSTSSTSHASEDVFTVQNVACLMISSTIGILIGDWTWLEGMRVLGARKIIIMDCLKPFLAALFGRVFLGEQLHLTAYAGLLFTIVGVTIVGLEKEESTVSASSSSASTRHDERHHDDDGVALETQLTSNLSEGDKLLPKLQPHSSTFDRQESYVEQRRQNVQSTKTFVYGLVNGFLNVFLHTVGSTLTKIYGAGMTTWEINLIRFGFAGLCMGMLSSGMTVYTKSKMAITQSQQSMDSLPWYSLPSLSVSSWTHVCLGVLCVTFLHPALVNYAMFQVPLALLLTLDSIGPLYSLPLGWLIQGNRPTYKACVGALLAVGGIAILAFKGMSAE
jgi:drug/metabolite transporter (DMT)-like permease